MIKFTKEYVLENTKRKLNQSYNTVPRDVSAINCFLDFVIRKGFKSYKIPNKSLPKEKRNFRARIFSDDEIQLMLAAADSTPFKKQIPDRYFQIPVIFRILFNCGLRISEVINLRLSDIDLTENILMALDTKFHKNRLVPFSDEVATTLKNYLEKAPTQGENDYIFRSPKTGEKYGDSTIHVFCSDIPYRAGRAGIRPRPYDIRHTSAVHCLNDWALSGVDLMAVLPVLSRYLGHSGKRRTEIFTTYSAKAPRYCGQDGRTIWQFNSDAGGAS
jgi:integrase